ncbi:MAG: sugar transferase [Bacteroidales bacterium]|nr:sugar transferase [Bacteroidales bacterium]
MIRIFDIFISLIGLLVLAPLFIVIMLIIPLDSRGCIFFLQSRVGHLGKEFRLIKFRTMVTDAQSRGGLTIGVRDSRITRAGRFLRKYKLDEIPQLINVLKGEMSLVGPRPEIRKYVEMYTEGQKQVLKVRPGITDYASIEYINENEILGKAENPEKTYIEEVMPAKIELNMKFIEHPTLANYFRILWKTLGRLIF